MPFLDDYLRTTYHQSIANASEDDVARYSHAIGEYRSVLTVNRTKTALRVFFRFLNDAGYLSDNPARLIRSTPTDRRIPSYLSIDEAKRLLGTIANSDSAIAKRDHATFSLLLGTGIRLGSLVGLNASDVNIAQGTITIRAKGGREETVFLNQQLCRLLRQHIDASATGDGRPLFRSRNGGRLGPRQVQLRLRHWLEVTGITKPLSVHSLRRTFAARLYSKTGDLHLVQRALGHRHITTTEIYVKVEDNALRKALANM
ncbi:MAG: tyrosine-type recombinase/integrase [Candidatus Eisenbacteria bacterium]|nr:tyrosine-type recombinase/integrase [Candidatus Eisenbacteria bacterium]